VSTKPPRRRPAVFTPFARRFTDERALDLNATIALYLRVRRQFEASTWAKPATLAAAIDVIFEDIKPAPPRQLHGPIKRAIADLLALEPTIFALPYTDPAACVLSLKDQVELRRFLRAKEHFLANDTRAFDQLAQALVSIFSAITKALPPIGANHHASTLTVPLADLLVEPAKLVDDIFTTFADEQLADLGMGHDIFRRLYFNICRVTGVDPADEQTRKPLTFASEADLPVDQLFEAYLADTPLRDLFKLPVPFVIPRRAFRSHGAIFAPTGHGKTQTLQSMIVSFLNEPDPPAMFIMDSMGAMLEKIEHLALFTTTLKDRLLVLDPHDEMPPALNFFKLQGGSHAQQMELFFYLFKAIDQTLTPRQATTVSFLVQLMQKVGGTLDTLRQVCEDKRPRYMEAIEALDPVARDFFVNQFYSKDALVSQTKAQIAARLYTVASNPTFNKMFSAKENKFNALQCIEEKKIVLINSDRLFLGDDASGVFGRFILAQCLAAALARARIDESKRHLALLIVDEAKQYFDEQTEKILSDARQFGLGFLFATQYVSQLPEGVRKAMYGNTSIKMIGPVEYADRVSLAREMNTTPEFIGSMRSYDRSHSEFAVHVRSDNLTPHAVKIAVPMGTLESQPQMNEPSHKMLRQKNRLAVTSPVEPIQGAPLPPTTNLQPPPAGSPSASSQWDSDHVEKE
jgi:hypothetical protein